jgi:hypothetical protein
LLFNLSILAIPAILAISLAPSPPSPSQGLKDLRNASQFGVGLSNTQRDSSQFGVGLSAFAFPITAITRDVGDHGDLLPPPPFSTSLLQTKGWAPFDKPVIRQS